MADLCEGCPPVGYPTDKTRCAECPRHPSTDDKHTQEATITVSYNDLGVVLGTGMPRRTDEEDAACQRLVKLWRAAASSPPLAAPERLCECFGDSGLHASTHTSGGRERCDMCGFPIQPQSADVLTAVNAASTASPEIEAIITDAWNTLKERCCATRPLDKAKRIVMLGEADFRAALTAASAAMEKKVSDADERAHYAEGVAQANIQRADDAEQSLATARDEAESLKATLAEADAAFFNVNQDRFVEWDIVEHIEARHAARTAAKDKGDAG